MIVEMAEVPLVRKNEMVRRLAAAAAAGEDIAGATALAAAKLTAERMEVQRLSNSCHDAELLLKKIKTELEKEKENKRRTLQQQQMAIQRSTRNEQLLAKAMRRRHELVRRLEQLQQEVAAMSEDHMTTAPAPPVLGTSRTPTYTDPSVTLLDESHSTSVALVEGQCHSLESRRLKAIQAANAEQRQRVALFRLKEEVESMERENRSIARSISILRRGGTEATALYSQLIKGKSNALEWEKETSSFNVTEVEMEERGESLISSVNF